MWRATVVSLLTLGISFGQTAEQAAGAEAAVAANPDDVSARLNLLGYYSAQGNHDARLSQLLWLIAHHPELSVFTSPAGSLPDPADYEQVKQAWGQALTTQSDDARVLVNAAWFFRIADKEQSIDLLQRALASNPANRQIADRLGNEYALILLAADASSSLKQSVRAELEQSTQPAVLFGAGSALQCCNAGGSADLTALASTLIERAKAIDPNVTPQRIRVGGNVQAVNLVKKVTPVYPAEAKEARIQGVVRFAVIIAKDGTIENLQLVSGHPLLVSAAQEAVKQWVYKPTLLNGLPVEVVTQIDVNFTLLP